MRIGAMRPDQRARLGIDREHIGAQVPEVRDMARARGGLDRAEIDRGAHAALRFEGPIHAAGRGIE